MKLFGFRVYLIGFACKKNIFYHLKKSLLSSKGDEEACCFRALDTTKSRNKKIFEEDFELKPT